MNMSVQIMVVLASIAAGCVSVSAVIVSYMQFLNARRKLKLDLYEKRVAIYNSVQRSIYRFVNPFCSDEEKLSGLNDMMNAIGGSQFLFEEKDGVQNEVSKISAQLIKIYNKELDIRTDTPPETIPGYGGLGTMLKKLGEKMMPYLDFRRI